MIKTCPEHQRKLQAFALNFIQRHHSEYLTYEYLLDRATRYLCTSFVLSEQDAYSIVEQALRSFTSIRHSKKVDAARSSSTNAVIYDPETGATWSIPVDLIFDRIICSPDSTRFRVTNT